MYEVDIMREFAFRLSLSTTLLFPLLPVSGAVGWLWEGERHRVPALSQGERERSTVRS